MPRSCATRARARPGSLGGSALFVSAGGYHHHMAMNTWNSAGAGRRRRTLGLGRVDILLPTPDDVGALGERMRHYGTPLVDRGPVLELEDPWANAVRITSPDPEPTPPALR